MTDEAGLKLAVNEDRDEDGFPIGCLCPDCESESCGALVFKCEEFKPMEGAGTIMMSISQFNRLVDKFTDINIFETLGGFYTTMNGGNTVVYAPKFKEESKNHNAV